MKKEYIKPELKVIEPKEEKGGNTGLPFGLCKKHGIKIGDNWTPRDAWNALKDKLGIEPEEVYKELNEENKVADAQVEVNKKTITGSKAFKTIKKNRDKIERAMDKLSSEQLGIVSKYIDKLYEFTDGSGQYGGSATYIRYPQNSIGTVVDKELGFDFDATTFYHEYGHFVDNIVSREQGNFSWTYDSDKTNVDEDALSSFNEILKEGGGNKPIKDFKRLERGQVQAFYNGLAKITGKDQLWLPKTRKDFGYVGQPYKPTYTPEQSKKLFGEASYERSLVLWDEYNKGVEAYQKAEADGTNANALKKLDEYGKQAEEHNKPYRAQMQRYAIVTDFFGLYTNNRIDPYNNGYHGHKGAYNKAMKAQTETWAEYFSFKMTNDTKGLEIMKKYLPKTYDAFEDKYNKLKEIKQNG